MSHSHSLFKAVQGHLKQRIIGQQNLIQRLLIALLADGHLLVEGAPGLAKTRAVRELAACLEGDFHRIQFTPDLLPSDLTGSEIFRPADASFQFEPGPLFHNLILADEINRSPAKVQSALLEAMAERQITIGHETYPLPSPFLVMATQNPIEQEGTYPLPEAQLDRFMLKVCIDYPDKDAERQILQLAHREFSNASGSQAASASTTKTPQITREQLQQARSEMQQLHFAESLQAYVVELIHATRNPAPFNRDYAHWVEYGASPRAGIALMRGARALAWLRERDHVNPEDIQAIAPEVLSHRIGLSFEAEASGATVQQLISGLILRVPLP